MPFLNVKITREGVTAEQKDRLIHGLTNVVVDVLGKDPDLTWVVIEEVDLADWGIGGVNVARARADGSTRSLHPGLVSPAPQAPQPKHRH